MVREECVTQWICPYCGDPYDTKDDAEECALECADVDSPSEKISSKYFCEMCGKKYDDEEDAEKCEYEHTKDDDIFYFEYVEKRKVAELLESGNHPYQTKIDMYCSTNKVISNKMP